MILHYNQIAEMQITVRGDFEGGNSQKTIISLTAEGQPFIVDGKDQANIEFTVYGEREMSEIFQGFDSIKKYIDAKREFDQKVKGLDVFSK